MTRPTRHPLGVLDHGFRIPPDEGDPLARLRRTLAEEGLRELPVRTDTGGAASVLLRCADELDASMIVCGSRNRGITERLVSSSVGFDVAAHAACPVFVIPPPDRPTSRPAW